MATLSQPPPPTTPPSPRERNPQTRALNRRESLWQIGLPVGLAALAAVGLLVLAALPDTPLQARSAWADVSLIFMICPTAVIGLILLAVIVAFSAGVFYAQRELPYGFKRLQDFMRRVAEVAKHYARYPAEAVLRLRSWAAAAQQAGESLRSVFKVGRSK